MHKLTFAFLIAPGVLAMQALVLAESVRRFAGALSGAPIWALLPQPAGELGAEVVAGLDALDVRLIPFDLAPEAFRFPFVDKSLACAVAEAEATGQSELLVCMDTPSLVVDEPGALLLPDDKVLGYRPVDHRLIGPSYGEPLGPFWSLIYDRCGVPKAHLFAMTGSVDGSVMYPYFNAGMLVVRPERGLLRAWGEQFLRLYRRPEFLAFYQDRLYAIFVHQAILAGTIMSLLEPSLLHELPYRVNYPLHMQRDYPADRRVACLNDLVTFRYEAFFQQPDWRQQIAVDEPLKSWLDAQPIVQMKEGK